MKYLLMLTIVLLAGCSYDESDMAAAERACAAKHGKMSVLYSDKQVWAAKCTIGGFKYTYDRFQGTFFGAEKSE